MSKPGIVELSAKFLAANEMAKAAGLKGKARLEVANQIVKDETGADCLELLGVGKGVDGGTAPKGLDWVEAFVKACCLTGECYFVPRSTLYDAYTLYCSQSGATPETSQHFAKLLRQVVKEVGHLYTREGVERQHCHTGICLRECVKQ